MGDKCTYADLMFIPWNNLPAGGAHGQDFVEKEFPEKFPKTYEWHQRLVSRDGVKRALAVFEEAKKAAGK